MKRGVQFRRMISVAAVLAAASLACSLGPRAPTPPASPIAVSTEAAGQLLESLQDAVKNAKDGVATIVITEEQITSYAAMRLAEQPDAPFKDPQIFLRDGQITVYGTASLSAFTAPGQVIMEPTINPDGTLKLALVKADFGAIPVPGPALAQLTTALNELITEQFNVGDAQLTITEVTVADGQMTVTGRVSQ